MEKICPRCKAVFCCNQENILECDCLMVPLNKQERLYIANSYDECLCNKCLWEMKEKSLAVCEISQEEYKK